MKTNQENAKLNDFYAAFNNCSDNEIVEPIAMTGFRVDYRSTGITSDFELFALKQIARKIYNFLQKCQRFSRTENYVIIVLLKSELLDIIAGRPIYSIDFNYKVVDVTEIV